MKTFGVIFIVLGIILFNFTGGLLRIVEPIACISIGIMLLVVGSHEFKDTKCVSTNPNKVNKNIDEIANKFLQAKMYNKLIAGILNSGAFKRIEISDYGVSCDKNKYIFMFNYHGYDKLKTKDDIKALGKAILQKLPNNESYTACELSARGLLKRNDVETFTYVLQTEFYDNMKWNEGMKCWEEYQSPY